MKYIVLLMLLAPCLAFGQRDKDVLREIAQDKSVFIPKSAEWYNSRQSFNTLDVKKKMLIIHFWDPSSLQGDLALEEVKTMAKERRQLFVVSVLRGDLPNAHNEEWVSRLIEINDIHHPVAVLDDLSSLKPYVLDEYGSYICLSQNGQFFRAQSIFDENRFLPALMDSITANDRNPALSTVPNVNELFNETPRIDGLFDLPVSICADNRRGRLFIADARKQQIIVVSDDGRVIETVGQGAKGNVDGRFAVARFNRPAGMAFDEENNVLYVADMLNHQIKAVDFKTGEVKSILGSGSKSLIPQKQIDGTTLAIDQPCDVILKGNELYIAMMGDRQIWKMDLLTKRAVPLAGNGDYKTQDGTGGEASFASINSMYLDADGNVVVLNTDKGLQRIINPKTGEVRTDSLGAELHALDVHIDQVLRYANATFYLDADKNCILRENVGQKPSVYVGSSTGESGTADGKKNKSRFWNPVDMCMLGNELIVLDQFNGLLRRVNTKKPKTSTIKLSDYKFIFMGADGYSLKHFEYLEELSIEYNERNEIAIDIQLPPGYKWDREGRNEIAIVEEREHRLLNTDPTSGYAVLDVQADAFFPNVTIQLFMTVRDENDQIRFKCVVLTIPFLFHENGETDFKVPYRPFG